jgi:hypothetical protein
MTRDGPDKARLARVVAEDPSNRADGLAERAVGHDHVAPDVVEDVPAMHGFAAMLHEEHEQIEVAGDERLLASVADENPAAGRQDEFAEAVTGIH